MNESASNPSDRWWERDKLSDLHRAAYAGDADTVRAILRDGRSPDCVDAPGNTPLFWACFKGRLSPEYVDVVRALLAAGAAVDLCGPEGEPPLFAACRAGVGEIVRQLLRAGADARASWGNRAPIAVAAESRCIECVQALLTAGADPSGRGAFGLSAREWAESNGYDDIITVLDAATQPGE